MNTPTRPRPPTRPTRSIRPPQPRRPRPTPAATPAVPCPQFSVRVHCPCTACNPSNGALPCPPHPTTPDSRAGRSLRLPPTRPELGQNAPRRASRVFWKKLLRARPRPISPHQSPVYTGANPPSPGAGVTANLNPTGTPRHSGRRYLPESSGVSVLSYVLVTAVFVIVLIVVLTSLGNSIGEGLQDLVDQIPISL